MPRSLLNTPGGSLLLPDTALVLVDREDGGNLLVNPPHEVWERGELTPAELVAWSFLVAAAGRAMLEALPQLAGGCINYWEAGNWALNHDASPVGPKTARERRRVHMHLLGRSPRAPSPSWRWGEAPTFPDFEDRFEWAAGHKRLTCDEATDIVTRADAILRDRYEVTDVEPWDRCGDCGYPAPSDDLEAGRCAECR